MRFQVLLQAGGMSAHGAPEGFLARVCADMTVPVRGPVKGLPAKGAEVSGPGSRPHLVVLRMLGVGCGGGVVMVVLLMVEGVLGVQWG